MDVKDFFTEEQKALIKSAIEKAEHKTSGEIRLHLENDCKGDAVERAVVLFHRLRMEKTKQRNAVLFYLAVNHKKLAVVGDEGIHQKVSDAFWTKVKDHMIARFKTGQYTEGLCEGIDMAGVEMKKHFPHDKDTINELPDDISFGN
ncbi:MAG TPA: TPM domain-containing protein [Bacteroidia bacterium]|jgi:uncharacterized membrane protein|nr:TPM domain-containing protein [Bacteroidia bacterium]